MKPAQKMLLVSIVAVLLAASISVPVTANSSNTLSSDMSPITNKTVTYVTNSTMSSSVSENTEPSQTSQIARSLVGATTTIYWDSVNPASGATNVSLHPTIKLTFHTSICGGDPFGFSYYLSKNASANCSSYDALYRNLAGSQFYHYSGPTCQYASGYVTLSLLVDNSGYFMDLDPGTTYYLFTKDSNGGCVQLSNFTTVAPAWSSWESMSGQFTASPAAVSWADGRIDVFGRGSDNALWHRSFNNTVWSAWESLGGQLAPTTGPAVSTWEAGHLDVFVIGSDQALWHRMYA